MKVPELHPLPTISLLLGFAYSSVICPWDHSCFYHFYFHASFSVPPKMPSLSLQKQAHTGRRITVAWSLIKCPFSGAGLVEVVAAWNKHICIKCSHTFVHL